MEESTLTAKFVVLKIANVFVSVCKSVGASSMRLIILLLTNIDAAAFKIFDAKTIMPIG